MTDDRLDYLLELWADWVHEGTWVDGFPARSTGLRSLASLDVDEMAAAADAQLAAAVAACVDDLQLHHQAALAHRYTEAVWRFPRLPYEEVLQQARAALREALLRRRVG